MQRGATRRGDIWPKLIVASLRVLILFRSLHLNIHFSIGMSSSVPYFFTPPNGEYQARSQKFFGDHTDTMELEPNYEN